MGAVQGQGALDHRGLVAPRRWRPARFPARPARLAGASSSAQAMAAAAVVLPMPILAADEQLAAGLLRRGARFRAWPRAPAGTVRRPSPGPRRSSRCPPPGAGGARRARLPGDGGAQVDHLQAGAEFARQHADRRAAADEVAQHLAGDRLRIGRDALGDYPVVAGEDRHPEPLQARSFAPLQRRQVDRHLLQAAQRAARLSQPVLAFGRAPAHLRVRLAAGVAPPLQTHSGSPFNGMGRPATVKVTCSQRSAMARCSQPASST